MALRSRQDANNIKEDINSIALEESVYVRKYLVRHIFNYKIHSRYSEDKMTKKIMIYFISLSIILSSCSSINIPTEKTSNDSLLPYKHVLFALDNSQYLNIMIWIKGLKD